MKKIGLFFVFFLTVGITSAQSLKPENPYPVQSGINKGTSDSLVGTHYWYFYAEPGSNRVSVRFKSGTTLFGAQQANTALTITLYDEKRTWKNTKIITPNKNSSEATFTAEKLPAKMKIFISIAPPNQNLVRMGGDYEIEATGNVAFDAVKNNADPIIRTYDSKVNSYGAIKFLANGTIEASDGSQGAWKSFDAENKIYTVQIDTFKWSVQYIPGYGLVKPGEPNNIVFQELRR